MTAPDGSMFARGALLHDFMTGDAADCDELRAAEYGAFDIDEHGVEPLTREQKRLMPRVRWLLDRCGAQTLETHTHDSNRVVARAYDDRTRRDPLGELLQCEREVARRPEVVGALHALRDAVEPLVGRGTHTMGDVRRAVQRRRPAAEFLTPLLDEAARLIGVVVALTDNALFYGVIFLRPAGGGGGERAAWALVADLAAAIGRYEDKRRNLGEAQRDAVAAAELRLEGVRFVVERYAVRRCECQMPPVGDEGRAQ